MDLCYAPRLRRNKVILSSGVLPPSLIARDIVFRIATCGWICSILFRAFVWCVISAGLLFAVCLCVAVMLCYAGSGRCSELRPCNCCFCCCWCRGWAVTLRDCCSGSIWVRFRSACAAVVHFTYGSVGCHFSFSLFL